MRRAMAMMISAVLMLSVFSAGCEDDSQKASETGLRIVTDGCIEFAIHIFIDDEFQDTIPSLQPTNILIPAGTYDLSARSNVAWNGNELCWTGRYTVRDGELTTVTLTCSDEQICGEI